MCWLKESKQYMYLLIKFCVCIWYDACLTQMNPQNAREVTLRDVVYVLFGWINQK